MKTLNRNSDVGRAPPPPPPPPPPPLLGASFCSWDAWQLLERRRDEDKQLVAGARTWPVGLWDKSRMCVSLNSPCHSFDNVCPAICLHQHFAFSLQLALSLTSVSVPLWLSAEMHLLITRSSLGCCRGSYNVFLTQTGSSTSTLISLKTQMRVAWNVCLTSAYVNLQATWWLMMITANCDNKVRGCSCVGHL